MSAIRVALVVGFFFLVPAACIRQGVRGLHECRANPEPAVAALSSLSGASRGWSSVSGCTIDIETRSPLEKTTRGGSLLSLYFPVVEEGKESEPVHLVLETKAPGRLAWAEAASRLKFVGAGAVEKSKAELRRLTRELTKPQVLTGMISAGADFDRRDRIPADWNVAPDFLLLEEGAEPSAASAVAWIVAGTLWLSFPFAIAALVILLARRKNGVRQDPPPSRSAAPATSGVASGIARTSRR
jgi:hypothetical protein